MCYNQDGAISLSYNPLKRLDSFTYLGSNISFSESDINMAQSVGAAEYTDFFSEKE